MPRIVNLQIICLPISSPIPAGYEKYERPGRPITRLRNKKFEYYVKVKDVEMEPTIPVVQDAEMESLAGFLGAHMNFTDTVIVPVVVENVVDVNIPEDNLVNLFSKLSTF